MRVQARIASLTIVQEAKVVEGSALESRISLVFSTIDRLHEELIRRGDLIRSSLTIEENFCKGLFSAFPK